MSAAKRERSREDAPPEAIKARPAAGPHSNDNKPYNNTLWRREYMRLDMRKRRAAKKAAKAKEARRKAKEARNAS
jgi:hypothetical protein